MLFLYGGEAFTPFRLQALSHRSKQEILTARYFYLIDHTVDYQPQDLSPLKTLLSDIQDLILAKEQLVWVVPRLGTISPWSSKATDIAHICGLHWAKRIERGIVFQLSHPITPTTSQCLFDPMTQTLLQHEQDLEKVFAHHAPGSLQTVPLLQQGHTALQTVNQNLGLALSDIEIDYLEKIYTEWQRDPTDVELMMFAQVNSEHCRHKIFNAAWNIDGKLSPYSLFAMIKHTHQTAHEKALVAYKDNAAVISGNTAQRLLLNPNNKTYQWQEEPCPIVFKVETHNHPTAISPFAGAATGSGGEIRDEAATGRGSHTKAGLCGFSTSHLHVPDFPQPWETPLNQPPHMASALEIMLDAPIGAAAFNNEFGRPNICGYFRTFEFHQPNSRSALGYHKPIMIAGGIGTMRLAHIEKKTLPPHSLLIVLGGPSMRIGLGGGSASSLSSGMSETDLDFASVQRANPEMQRRAQEVINYCVALGESNPILSLHDVGAGGLSNALPELVAETLGGAHIHLRAIPSSEPSMSPLALWCNEAQERFVLAIAAAQLPLFDEIAKRERCPYAVAGETEAKPNFKVSDSLLANTPVDMPLSALFKNMPPKTMTVSTQTALATEWSTSEIVLSEAIQRVLQFPCVSAKNFLITIGDRSVGGLVARDQMVGPWQVPVADVGVTVSGFTTYQGEALTMGERAPIAAIHPAASARMAVGEAITNIAAAPIAKLSDIFLSANWMAAADQPQEASALYAAVEAVGLEFCPALGISIPVGKDSLSMRATWHHSQHSYQITSPVSLIISATARVTDARRVLTPQLQTDCGDTLLLLIDLSEGVNALGASVLAQCYQALGQKPADIDNPSLLKQFFALIQTLNQQNLLLAYHDRSDGGLLATIAEMAFASHIGVTIHLDNYCKDPIAALFSEELGAVIQISQEQGPLVKNYLQQYGLSHCTHEIGHLNAEDALIIKSANQIIYRETRVQLQRLWLETSFRLQAQRDNPVCAQQEHDNLLANDPGLNAKPSFDFHTNISAPYINTGVRPKVAILREQGVNGHIEMAAAFDLAGFTAEDVHMTDLLTQKIQLNEFVGLAACGGFSYGDVLGAGRGWAQSILMHEKMRSMFVDFFADKKTFTLGVCNGCQMLSQLKTIIPGAAAWPSFQRNTSEQYEARLTMVRVGPTVSLFFTNMQESCLPIIVAHGEGRATFIEPDIHLSPQQIPLRYINNHHEVTQRYPYNPNGSVQGIAGITNEDGRITALMPHPERAFRSIQHSWHPKEWPEYAPWMQLFRNARVWVG